MKTRVTPCLYCGTDGSNLAPSNRESGRRLRRPAVELIGAGAVMTSDGSPLPYVPDHGFGCLEPHIDMLADQRRTSRYLAAIRRAVRSDDVVLDLGTGTGILAIAAAQAGARRVFAIERSGIADGSCK